MKRVFSILLVLCLLATLPVSAFAAEDTAIREAFETGSGSAVRNSSTLTEQTYYEACRLTDGTVLRISTNQASAWALMMDLLWPIILIAVLAIGLSLILARRMAKNIVEPRITPTAPQQ